ncbi:MAG: aquaporin family protein [Verrucomicrobia bacterium]|nr:aquaporin family protein [Verrucomicrobiota bacterium]
MSIFIAELVGTMILILLGNGVVANVVLTGTKANGSGWMVITTGWGLAVAMAVYMVNPISGAHLNPAVTIGLAVIGKLPISLVPIYLLAQLSGAFLGATMVWLTYLPHWAGTTDGPTKRAAFCTDPAIRHTGCNLVAEAVGTFVLMLGVLAILSPENLVANSGFDKGFAPFLVGVLVWSIGLSLGGLTGYAINPARDLGPRLAHALLPIPGKTNSDWAYAWIPIVGPIIGGIGGALFYQVVWPLMGH